KGSAILGCVGCLVGHLFMFLVGGKTPDQSVHLNLTTTRTADQLTELFEFKDDGKLSYFAVSAVPAGETDGWLQLNLQIPYRAL
ncbi:hypothetical protein M1V74_26300, partial [Klebsiella pneumoniae]|nr:hypothetical protein [Klebsiella pneumoniae]